MLFRAAPTETPKIDTFNFLLQIRIPNSLIQSNEGHWPAAIRTLKNEYVGIHEAILLLSLWVRQKHNSLKLRNFATERRRYLAVSSHF
jgi:hypothetical protein